MALDQDQMEAPERAGARVTTSTSTGTARMTFETLAVSGFIFGLFAIVIAAFAIVISARAEPTTGGSNDPSSTSAPAGPSGPTVQEVALGEFYIKPADATVPVDAVITVKNDGTVQHDLAVEGTSNASELLDPGTEGTLDLTGLTAGTYTWACQVPGHAAAGMTGTFTIG